MDKNLKIVVVDDNTDYLFTMETFLKRNGFEVLTADDGQKGLELIRKEHPDVVLLDVMMESLFSGFELCKQLRSEDDLKYIPIIGISGMGDELGINYKQWPDFEYFSPDVFLDKPVDKQRLLQLIPETLEKAKKRKKRPKWKETMDKDSAERHPIRNKTILTAGCQNKPDKRLTIISAGLHRSGDPELKR